MSEPLRVLIVEDSEDDALLIIDVLSRGGYETAWERVCDTDAMAAALDRHPWDIVISDHRMPRFDALSALKLLRSRGLDVPFIIVSGKIGEDSAVAAMKAGANDYIMKNALARLVPAVARELRDAETRRGQKHSEAALRESEARYRALFENSPMQTLVVDVEGRIMAFNFARRESVGRLPRIGDRMYVDYAKRHTIDMRRELMGCIATGTPKEFLERKYKDSILSIKMSPFPGGAMIISEDITERVRAEEVRKKLTEKLENARRMESLGVLAAGVAHDLNNILVPLLAYPDLMLARLPEDDPLRNYASRIKESAETAAEIVQDLLTMARRGRCEMEPLNLNDEVESFLRSPEFAELKAENPDVSIAIGLDTDIMNISTSAGYLTKIFMNLVINAFDAMSEVGALRIGTSCEYADRPLGGYDYIKEGDYVVLRIGDTGSGIDESDLKRIFEPFYSKKEMGRSGSGLGLSIVYGIVRDHGGYIDVRTELGVGSEFAVFFPVTRDLVRKKTEIAFDSRGNETILVVDDVERQREVAKDLLSSLGYNVETAEDGRAAIKYLETNAADLVLLDMIMDDDFDGLDTYRRILETHPSQRAVIVSGYSETSGVKEARALGAGMYVRKPYTLDKIGRAVRTELDRD